MTNQPDTAPDLTANWPPAVRDAFWTAVNAPTYEESTAATLAFAQLLTAPAVVPAADRATVLTEAERTMLTYALDQAQEHIWSRDGFTDEDQAAVTSLRRLAAEATPEPAELAVDPWADGGRLAQTGIDTPGCDCGHDGMGEAWHGDACEWKSIPPCDHCKVRGHSFEDCPAAEAPATEEQDADEEPQP